MYEHHKKLQAELYLERIGKQHDLSDGSRGKDWVKRSQLCA